MQADAGLLLLLLPAAAVDQQTLARCSKASYTETCVDASARQTNNHSSLCNGYISWVADVEQLQAFITCHPTDAPIAHHVHRNNYHHHPKHETHAMWVEPTWHARSVHPGLHPTHPMVHDAAGGVLYDVTHSHAAEPATPASHQPLSKHDNRKVMRHAPSPDSF
jgi:hypothetical protein